MSEELLDVALRHGHCCATVHVEGRVDGEPGLGARDSAPRELDALLARAGDADIVLIGEATHGTHELYALRAGLTRRLIAEHGSSAVAPEADFPDAYRVKRRVEGAGADETASEAFSGFERFPARMWRNRDVLELVEWLRGHNDAQPAEVKVGFYGLDLYSLHASMEAVLAYLDRVDPVAAGRARERYACFAPFGSEPEEYGRHASFGLSKDGEEEVVEQLVELRERRAELLSSDGASAADAGRGRKSWSGRTTRTWGTRAPPT